ncbi:MAG: tRNA uridine-5-carboxymethylaminomethyl(34) synthesis GTPase MnmE, partial [Clostridia bacterium]|nr:tRNA uridine-5-carboxymethylaminomethyl(34) synthesis GTPase MnmE [Clostridia bacterium]
MSARTIAAISTPPGEGGISVIRISGDDALSVADKCFRSFSGKSLSSLKGYSALYGEIVSGHDVVDDAVALVFRAPKSYTGEDTVELSVHGGKLVAQKVLRIAFDCGAVPADRGEFTKRAFLNGKIDLTRAESIIKVITAKNDIALKISQSAKNGRIAKEINTIIERLLELAASFSVYADYPDEEIENLDPDSFLASINDILKRFSDMTDNYDTGKKICDGIECVIVGKPNVGKSTLMNRLCKCDRSIVTDVAGTTRDVVDSTVVLDDITLILSDTAGIRKTADAVEKAGVDRSIDKLNASSLIIAVFDLSRPFDDDDRNILEMLPDNAIIVLNKSDLERAIDRSFFKTGNVVEISAKNDLGIERLTDLILKTVKCENLDVDDAILISERQLDCVKKATESLVEAKRAMENNVTLDAVGICIDDALGWLYELTGK